MLDPLRITKIGKVIKDHLELTPLSDKFDDPSRIENESKIDCDIPTDVIVT